MELELQFVRSVIPCLRSVIREVQNHEQTQEIKLSEGMPDIGKVLASWGQVLIRSKEWRSGGMSVSGGVMVWVLYAPEDGSAPRRVETWLPFQMKWDFPETQNDGMIRVIPLLRNVDARSVSARKMMVRATVGMLGEAMVSGEAELYNPGELPEDIQILKKSYPMMLPKEAGEKMFTLDETLSLPANVPAIEKIVRYELNPQLAESKVVSDKLVFRGSGLLHVLYMGIDGQLYTWDFEIPFSQFAELDREYEQDASSHVDLAVTNLELDPAEEDNLNLRAGITAQYIVYDRPVIELVEDAYSPRRNVTPQMSRLVVPAVLDTHSENVRAEGSMDINYMQVADAAFYADHPKVRRDEDRVYAELSGGFQTLGYDEEHALQNASTRWENAWELPASEDSNIDMVMQKTGNTTALISGNGTNVNTDLRVEAMTTAQQGLPMVTGLQMGELTEPDPGRPSLILMKAGTDSLWDIAKQTGSTVDDIRKVNQLQQDPDSEQMLLIPVV